MKKNNEYLSKLEKDYKGLMSALKKKDKEIAETWFGRFQNDYKKYKEDIDYKENTSKSNTAELGSMFESALPRLFRKNRRAVGEVLKLIKEDKNIKSQLQFFEAMKNYDGSMNASEYINESVELASKNIDLKTLRESNSKFSSLIIKYGIKPDVLDEDKTDYFNSGTYLLTHKKKLTNLNEIYKNRHVVEDYINSHKKNISEDKINLKKITEEFDKKMSLLNEEEKSLVQDIINSRSSVAEARQKKFFTNLKEKCITKIDKLMAESKEDDKEGLSVIREEISKMEYCKETIIKDTAKLLEIGAVLSDNDNKKYM